MAKKKNSNFLAEYWEWLVAVAGIAVLAVSVVGFVVGTDGEQTATDYRNEFAGRPKTGEGVKNADLTLPEIALARIGEPPQLEELDAKMPSFLNSAKRVLCQNKECGKAISGNAKNCPYCNAAQEEPVKEEKDTDHDGLPNDWELKYGLNPSDPADAEQDTDKDGFTNLEEYEAETDPSDPDSHPDYLNYFRVGGPLKQTELPFVFNAYVPLPGDKFRYFFVVKGRKDSYGQALKVNALEGEEVTATIGKKEVKSGFTVGKFTKKLVKRKIAGSGAGAEKEYDQSTIELVRKKDGKKVVAVLGAKVVPVDKQGTLAFERGDFGPFTVIVGSKVKVFEREYEVRSLGGTAEQPSITIKDLKTGDEKIVR